MFEDLAPWTHAALFAAAAVVVWLAGSRLARSADRIAEATGLGRDVLGILLLGGVTSLPELAVAVSATLAGTPVLGISDALGSASVQLLILAIADAIAGRQALTSAPGTPAVMLQATLGIVLLSLVVGAGLAGDVLVWGMGAWSWLMAVCYIGAIWMISRSHGAGAWVPGRNPTPEPRADKADSEQETPLRPLVLRTVAAAGAILVGGFVLARTGEALAEQTGLGMSFFGAVLLGFSTALPEASTVIAAVRLKRYEMALADVLGANLAAVAIIVVVDALHPGAPVLAEAGRFASFAALLAIVMTALFLVGMIERRDRTVLRMGTDSLGAIACYAAGVVVLFLLR